MKHARTEHPHGSQLRLPSGWILLIILLALEWLAGRAHAAVVAAPRISLVVYSDKPIRDEEWTALNASLRDGFDRLAVEMHFPQGGFEVLRAETMAPGVQFEEAIPVYLHGACRVALQPGTRHENGALGWVLHDRGQIQPFIHVDCSRIAEVLAQFASGMDAKRRNSVMAEAISRVVLHEWVHIARQSASHDRDGIEKSVFGVRDLVPDFAQPWAPASHGR